MTKGKLRNAGKAISADIGDLVVLSARVRVNVRGIPFDVCLDANHVDIDKAPPESPKPSEWTRSLTAMLHRQTEGWRQGHLSESDRGTWPWGELSMEDYQKLRNSIVHRGKRISMEQAEAAWRTALASVKGGVSAQTRPGYSTLLSGDRPPFSQH